MEVRGRLRVHRGKLAPEGVAVHAATFLREGKIILDRDLLRRPSELRRIFFHELCHFVWWKLGNPRRLGWETLLAVEMGRRARGELGWSAEMRKERLTPRDVEERTRDWREYCCESFCDTGASLFFERRQHSEFTLAERYRRIRESWLRQGDIIRDEEQLVQFVEPRDGRNGFVWLGDMPCLLPGADDGARSSDEGFERSQSGAGL